MDGVPAGELQFDRVEAADRSLAAGVRCTLCDQALLAYYDVNGTVTCESCQHRLVAFAETPTGVRPLLKAGVFGLAASIAGAIVYYLVLALAHLEIGLVAILCGYMVGWAVRKAAGGRGGLRFQLLATVLTYTSVALAYTPLVIQASLAQARTGRAAQTTSASSTVPPPAAAARSATAPAPVEARSGNGGLGRALIILTVVVLLAPIVVVMASLPSGIISAAIIVFGLRQAWRMTGTPSLMVLGPYKVNEAVGSVPA